MEATLKKQMARGGDRNTKYFQAIASARRCVNQITAIVVKRQGMG